MVAVCDFGALSSNARKIITSTDFYQHCRPDASAPVLVKNQSPIIFGNPSGHASDIIASESPTYGVPVRRQELPLPLQSKY